MLPIQAEHQALNRCSVNIWLTDQRLNTGLLSVLETHQTFLPQVFGMCFFCLKYSHPHSSPGEVLLSLQSYLYRETPAELSPSPQTEVLHTTSHTLQFCVDVHDDLINIYLPHLTISSIQGEIPVTSAVIAERPLLPVQPPPLQTCGSLSSGDFVSPSSRTSLENFLLSHPGSHNL